jgi:hypothetical protein
MDIEYGIGGSFPFSREWLLMINGQSLDSVQTGDFRGVL